MLEVSRSQLKRYGVSVISVLLALLLSLPLQPLLNLEISPLFFAAVVFSSWYGGLFPGLVAIVFATLVNDFFFLPPLHGLSIDNWADILQLVVFSFIALMIRTETALRESEARYRSLVRATSQMVWITAPDGQIVDMPDWRAYTGQTQAEVKGWGWLDAVHPDDRQRTAQTWSQAVQTRSIYDTEYRIRRADGEYRHFSARGVPVVERNNRIREWIGICTDITDRKQMEAERDRGELLFRTLANTMPQMLWITQPDGHHEYFNQRWYDYTGIDLEQAKRDGWQTVLHPDDVKRTKEIWYNALRTGTTYEIEYRLQSVDGEYRWHLGRALPLHDQAGQIVKWFGSCTEIHDQKLAIEERAQALERERAARIELERASRVKDEFLAIVSHELRSPLNPIVGWSQLLRTRKLSAEKVDQALEIIERNAKLQARLIEDLLDVSRILRGKLSLDTTPVDLISTIEAAIETVHLTAESKSIDLTFSILDNHTNNKQRTGNQQPEKFTVLGDTNRLQQIVWNLLTNAVKFTPVAGKVDIKLEKHKLEKHQLARQASNRLSPASCPLHPEYAQITVTDTGKGIASDFLPHMFDRFQQADEATTRKFGGLGLGLAIVQHLVELHGGVVAADSAGDGQGATFTLSLPLMAEHESIAPYRVLANPDFSLVGLRIVVVDDIADTLHLLTFMLEERGANVIPVSSASQALEAITTTAPDLLLSDIAMPVTDGYALIRQVRALHKSTGKFLPAIALTAFAGETDRQRIIESGFQKHLTKPIDPNELAATIAELTSTNLAKPNNPQLVIGN